MATSAAYAAPISVPTSMRPVVSMVTCTWMARVRPVSAIALRQACMAALICSRSMHVSMRKRSQPPSMSPSACSTYASRRSENEMCPSEGSFVPGPMEPAT
ncbi:MAG: hypothetical protein RLZZ93_380 [Actinomycetota bacterium]